MERGRREALMYLNIRPCAVHEPPLSIAVRELNVPKRESDGEGTGVRQ
jgi:hypothetical protein